MSIGIWQVLIVAILVFILFGAGRLPRIMEDMAKGIKSFKKGMAEEDQETDEKSAEKKRITDARADNTTADHKAKADSHTDNIDR